MAAVEDDIPDRSEADYRAIVKKRNERTIDKANENLADMSLYMSLCSTMNSKSTSVDIELPSSLEEKYEKTRIDWSHYDVLQKGVKATDRYKRPPSMKEDKARTIREVNADILIYFKKSVGTVLYEPCEEWIRKLVGAVDGNIAYISNAIETFRVPRYAAVFYAHPFRVVGLHNTKLYIVFADNKVVIDYFFYYFF